MNYGWIRLFIGLVFVMVGGCQSEHEVNTAVYRVTLADLSAEVTATTLPLAQAMAQGQTPSKEMVIQAQTQLTAVQNELEALEPPPAELGSAHQHLTEAITQFQQAYDHLANNLEAGEATPFDQEFLTLAAHGGEAIHQMTADLAAEQETK